METTGDRTTVTAEGVRAKNDKVDTAKTEEVDPAKSTLKERGTPPPGETREIRARIPERSESSSTSDQEAFLTAQAAAGATGSVSPPGHRTIRPSLSSDDPSVLASIARIEARFQRIDLKLCALNQSQSSGTQPTRRLYRNPTPVRFHPDSAETPQVDIEPQSGRRVWDTLTKDTSPTRLSREKPRTNHRNLRF